MQTRECVARVVWACVCVLAGVGVAWGADDAAPLKPGAPVVLKMRDGSRIMGTTAVTSLVLRTSFAEMAIPVLHIAEVEMRHGEVGAVVSLRNGDRLSGEIRMTALLVETVFGAHAFALAALERVQFGGRLRVPAELARHLVLHYSFDTDTDTGDGRVADASGWENHGVRKGQITSDGRVGDGLLLGGDGAHVDAGNGESLRLTSDFTVSAWIWPDEAPGAFGIVNKSHGYPEQNRRGFELALAENGVVGGYFWDEAGRYMSGDAAGRRVTRRAWTHVALTHDPTRPERQMRIFIDGQPCDMHFGYETTRTVPTVRDVAEPVRIGCTRPGYQGFVGRLDEVMIFNRCLTDEEMARLYQSMP